MSDNIKLNNTPFMLLVTESEIQGSELGKVLGLIGKRADEQEHDPRHSSLQYQQILDRKREECASRYYQQILSSKHIPGGELITAYLSELVKSIKAGNHDVELGISTETQCDSGSLIVKHINDIKSGRYDFLVELLGSNKIGLGLGKEKQSEELEEEAPSLRPKYDNVLEKAKGNQFSNVNRANDLAELKAKMNEYDLRYNEIQSVYQEILELRAKLDKE